MPTPRSDSRRTPLLSLLLAAFALCALGSATPVRAASITSVTATTLVTTTTQGGPEAEDYYAVAGFFEDCGAGCTDFTSRFAGSAGVEADVGENLHITANWSYTVDIAVDAPGEAWELDIDTELRGYLTLLDPGPGSGRGRARLRDLVGTLDTSGLSSTGSLDLPGLDQVAGASGANQEVLRLDNFRVTGGFGSTTVSMTFTLEGHVRSQCNGGGCTNGGDEAAIRLGLPSPGAPDIVGFTAGDYPGPDLQQSDAHGHFMAVSLVLLPEPASAWLLLAGFAGLGLARRCRS